MYVNRLVQNTYSRRITDHLNLGQLMEKYIGLIKMHLYFFFLYRFYPYIMLISALFPLITLIIYTVVPNLLTPYSRLMRHFTVSIMMAFICLAIVQLATNLNRNSPKFCTFLGNMAIMVEFSSRGYKIGKIFAKSTYLKEIIEF